LRASFALFFCAIVRSPSVVEEGARAGAGAGAEVGP